MLLATQWTLRRTDNGWTIRNYNTTTLINRFVALPGVTPDNGILVRAMINNSQEWQIWPEDVNPDQDAFRYV
jgi:hypothetical protein